MITQINLQTRQASGHATLPGLKNETDSPEPTLRKEHAIYIGGRHRGHEIANEITDATPLGSQSLVGRFLQLFS